MNGFSFTVTGILNASSSTNHCSPRTQCSRNTRSAHLISVLSSLGRALGQWGWGPAQIIMGQAQPLAGWCRALSVVHAQMGPCSYIELRVWRCRTNPEQTAEHIILICPVHRAPTGIRGLTVLDVDTRCWLSIITASI